MAAMTVTVAVVEETHSLWTRTEDGFFHADSFFLPSQTASERITLALDDAVHYNWCERELKWHVVYVSCNSAVSHYKNVRGEERRIVNVRVAAHLI